jgi:hypothetical protein
VAYYLLIILVQVSQLELKRVKYVMKKILERIGTSIDVIVCGTVHTSKGILVEETLV